VADNFLNDPTWAPQGFVSAADEADMYYAAVNRNIRIPGMLYAQNVPFTKDADHGDEVYGGDSFQYIPTETQVAAAVTMANMMTAGELPVQSNDPGMNQLLQSLYQRTADFWNQLRQASGTGW
jgi:hypothetical protein